MKEWTVEELRQHLGEIIDTRRPRTPLEERAIGPGEEGGRGVLVAVREDNGFVTHQDVCESWGPVPWIEVDYGMSWAILPGTEITFTGVAGLERELAELRGRLVTIGDPVGYLIVDDNLDRTRVLADWDGLVHPTREEADRECAKANEPGFPPDDPTDIFRVATVCEPREARVGQWLDFVAPPQPPVGAAARNSRLMEWHRRDRGWFYRHNDGSFGARVWDWQGVLAQGAVEIIAMGDVDG